jgi:hypothetical protein
MHVKSVVKCQLLVFLNITLGEDADTDLTLHVPLLSLAIGVTAVIYESGEISLLSRVNYFRVAGAHEISTSQTLIFSQSLLADFRVNFINLSHILNNKTPFLNKLSSTQSPASAVRFDRIYIKMFIILKSSISAIFPTGTELCDTLSAE